MLSVLFLTASGASVYVFLSSGGAERVRELLANKPDGNPTEAKKTADAKDEEPTAKLTDKDKVVLGGSTVLVGILVCGGSLFYFLPTVVSWGRGHQNGAAIFMLNLLLGWTFLGWVAALVWAFTEVSRRRYVDD